jgi:hypothetical protein
MPSDKFFVSDDVGGIEPITVTFPQGERVSGFSRSKLYELAGAGDIDVIKSGRRSLIIFESLKRYIGRLPRAQIKTLPPRRHPKANQEK